MILSWFHVFERQAIHVQSAQMCFQDCSAWLITPVISQDLDNNCDLIYYFSRPIVMKFSTIFHNHHFRHSTTSYSSSSSDDEEVRTRSNMAASSTSSGAAAGGGAATSGGGAQLRTLQQRRARQLELLEKFEKRLRSHKPQVYCMNMIIGCK